MQEIALKVLLTGANGQVGRELLRSLMPVAEVVAVTRAQCDFAHPDRVRELVRETRPYVIVNAAAYTAVDRAESEEALATTINGISVGVLAEEGQRLGALLVHYSTDYVFAGSKPTPYVEDDATGPINAYGRSKLAGENAVRACGGDYLILRTSWVYAAHGQNFVKTMLRLGSERERLTIVDDQRGAPTWARNIADATAHVVSQTNAERAERKFTSNIFHVAAGGATTWFRFADAIFATIKVAHPTLSLRLTELVPIPSEAIRRRRCARLIPASTAERLLGVLALFCRSGMPHFASALMTYSCDTMDHDRDGNIFWVELNRRSGMPQIR